MGAEFADSAVSLLCDADRVCNRMTNQSAQPSDPNQTAQQSHRVQAVVITLILALVVILPLILSGNARGRGAADDWNYHWVAIQKFALEWPSPSLGDYDSATTPGYHLALTPLVNIGLGHTGAQLIAMSWTLALLGLMCWVLSRQLGRSSIALMVPMLASMYVLYPGIWLLPDNAAWLMVLGVILLALRSTSTWATLVLSSAIAALLVFTRQIHIWVAGVVWLSAWLGTTDTPPDRIRTLFSNVSARAGRTLISMACTVPAFLVLIWFYLTWNGLVPPMFQGKHQGPNLATPGFILLQLAIISVFFAPILLPRLKALWTHHWQWVLASVGIGLVCAVVPESSYSVEAGRYSGWWNLIKIAPSVAERSSVYILGVIAGSLALPLWLSLAPRRDVWIWVGTLVAFVAAQSANHASWQRYHEPMLLIMTLLILSRSTDIDRQRVRAMIGAIMMGLVYGSLTIMSMAKAQPFEPREDLVSKFPQPPANIADS
jgi:hypothetical protein